METFQLIMSEALTISIDRTLIYNIQIFKKIIISVDILLYNTKIIVIGIYSMLSQKYNLKL